MTYYTVCPSYGYKLLKAGDGSTIEIRCSKCGAKMLERYIEKLNEYGRRGD